MASVIAQQVAESHRSRILVRWLAFAAAVIATIATLAVPSPALAGTSYFPTFKLSTGSGQGVNLKAGVYVFSQGDDHLLWTKTYAASYGAPNHRVDFQLVTAGSTSVQYHHPNVGTGTWEDCLRGTNTNCNGYDSLGPNDYLMATARNLSTGVCRWSMLTTEAMLTSRSWSAAHAC